MKKLISILLIVANSVAVSGQNFEGKISYSNIYKSKKWYVSDEKLNSLMGTKQDFFIMGGNYKTITNGTVQWTQYINKDNKMYTKVLDNETIYWNDASIQNDKILKSEINKNAIEILGYKCDELILTCNSGIQKYYFSSKVAVDYKLYPNCKVGNWYDYLKLTNAIALKIIIDNDKLSLVSIATEVKEMKLDPKSFELPAKCQIKKNPFEKE